MSAAFARLGAVERSEVQRFEAFLHRCERQVLGCRWGWALGAGVGLCIGGVSGLSRGACALGTRRSPVGVPVGFLALVHSLGGSPCARCALCGK